MKATEKYYIVGQDAQRRLVLLGKGTHGMPYRSEPEAEEDLARCATDHPEYSFVAVLVQSGPRRRSQNLGRGRRL